MFRFLVLIVGIVAAAHAHPTGVPISACTNMIPGHEVPPQTEPSPYRILINKDVIHAGEEVKVTLEGIKDEKFKGVLLQARKGNEIVGKFMVDPSSDSEVQIMDCPNGTENAVTHKNSDDKSRISVNWIAPTDFEGTVVFKATFVKSRFIFWVAQESASLAVQH